MQMRLAVCGAEILLAIAQIEFSNWKLHIAYCKNCLKLGQN